MDSNGKKIKAKELVVVYAKNEFRGKSLIVLLKD